MGNYIVTDSEGADTIILFKKGIVSMTFSKTEAYSTTDTALTISLTVNKPSITSSCTALNIIKTGFTIKHIRVHILLIGKLL